MQPLGHVLDAIVEKARKSSLPQKHCQPDKTSTRMPMPINEALSAPAKPCSSNVGTVVNISLAKMDKDDTVWLDPCYRALTHFSSAKLRS